VAVLYVLLALAAGAMLPFQAGVNARLAHFVESPIRASLVSFVVGTIVLLVLSIAIFKPLPAGSKLAGAPWWVWVGGVLGAFYVVVTVVSAPRVGAATLIAALIAGQMVASLVVDHFGWVGFPVHHVSAGRVVGLVLLFAGVLLVRLF
jgi:bacterial/archaeal transporter family-2 protein